MGNVNSFEYKIHVSIDQDSVKGDVKNILKNMQAEAKNGAYKIELTGDPKKLIQQLAELKKHIPTLDLNEGLKFDLADAIKDDTEKGKKLINEFTTYIINSVSEAVTSIDAISESIKSTEAALVGLQQRKKDLLKDDGTADVVTAFEKAQERLIKASDKFSDSKQNKGRLAAATEMKQAYQDMLNYQNEAGKEMSDKAKQVLAVFAQDSANAFKDANGELTTLKEYLGNIKVNSSYKKDLQDIETQILTNQNKLSSLKKDLESAMNPELKVKGKLADNFLGDLQSQLDQMTGLEVKVKPKIDKNQKIELEVETKPIEATDTIVDEVKNDVNDVNDKVEKAVKNFSYLKEKVDDYKENTKIADSGDIYMTQHYSHDWSKISTRVNSGDIRNGAPKIKEIKYQLDQYLRIKKDVESGKSNIFDQKSLDNQLDKLAAYVYSLHNAEKAAEIFGEKNKEVFNLVQERIQQNIEAGKAHTYASWNRDFIIQSLKQDYGVGKITVGQGDQLMKAIETGGIEAFASKVKELFGIEIPTSVEQAKIALEEVNNTASAPIDTTNQEREKVSLQGITEAAKEAEEAITEEKNAEKDSPKILDHVPEGWEKVKYAVTAPKGYEWYSNGKGLLEYESALVKVNNTTDEAIEKQEQLSNAEEKVAQSQDKIKEAYERYQKKPPYDQNQYISAASGYAMGAAESDSSRSALYYLKEAREGYELSLEKNWDWENQYAFALRFVKLFEAYKDKGGTEKTLAKHKELYEQLKPLAEGYKKDLQAIIDYESNQEKAYIDNAIAKQQEIDDWTKENVNAQLYPPVVDYISTEEELQSAIDKITEYRNDLQAIAKDKSFSKLSDNMQSDVLRTIGYLDNLIKTEERLLDMQRQMKQVDDSQESITEAEPDINKVRDALGSIMDKMNTSQVTGKNLFSWIVENGTEAEKELFNVSKGYEEFQKLLVSSSFGSRGLFEYRNGAGLDTFNYNKNNLLSSSSTPSSSAISQLEKEAGIRQENVEITNAQIEAELKRQSITSNPSNPIPNVSENNTNDIQQRTTELEHETEAAEEAAEAEEHLNEVIRDHVYKNQNGDVRSGNYSYDRYDDDNRNLAEKYHGVVSTNKETGDISFSERLIVNYDKLLSELIKYDTQIYKLEQEINQAQGDTSGLEKKKSLAENQLKLYTDLMDKITTNPDYVTNADQEQLNYIKEQRDLKRQILEADALIAKARQDESNKQNAINQELKIRESSYAKIWELNSKIALADKTEDSEKINVWKRHLDYYKNIYDSATQTLKQLDQQKLAEQDLNSLAKIRAEIGQKYTSSKAAQADNERKSNIKSTIQDEKSAYEKIWDIRKKLVTLDPKKNADEIAELKRQEKEQQQIYLTEIKKLEAIDHEIAKETVLYNNLTKRKQIEEEIRLIKAGQSDTNRVDEEKSNQAQTQYAVKAQKRLGSLRALKYKTENNPYVNPDDNSISIIDSLIQKYETEIATIQKLNLTQEQKKAIDDAEVESNLTLQKAIDQVTAAQNKQEEAGKKHQQVLDNTRASLQKQATALTTNGKLMSVYGRQVHSLIEEIKNPTTTLERLSAIRIELNKISADAIAAGKSGQTLFQIIQQRAKSLVAYLGTFASFYRLVGYVKEGITTIEELDTQLVDLRKTTVMSTEELNQFYYESSNVAKQLGVTTSEIIQQAANWSRLGYNTKEAATEMAKLSSQFATISPGMTTDVAQSGLVSIMKAWKIDVADVESEIMDKINVLGNNFAESNEDIIQGMERSAAALSAVGTTYEDAFALFTGGQEILQNAEKMGTGLRSVSMRLRGVNEETEEVDDELTNITGDLIDLTKTANNKQGVSIFKEGSTTEFKSLVDYFREIHDVWDDMTEKQRSDFLAKAFGKVQAQTGAAIIQNFDQIDKALEKMENSAGAADKEMSIVEESIDFKLNALKQTWVSILQKMVDRGDIGKVVDSLTTISEAIGKLIPRLSTSVPLLSTLAGTLTLISGIKLGNFVKSIDMLEKFQTLSQIGSGISGLGGIAGLPILDENGNGIAAGIATYRKAIQGLSAENAALVLSTTNLTNAEVEAILTTKDATIGIAAKTDAEAQEIMTLMGLTSAMSILDETQIKNLATEVGITAETDKQILSALGLTVTKEGELVATNALNKAELQKLVTDGMLTEEQYNLIIGIAGVTTAEKAQIGVTNVLKGALAKLWATMLANPLLTVATLLAAATVGWVTYTQKVKEARAETAKAAKTDWESANKSHLDNADNFSNLSQKYVELSKGVNTLGQNVSLTTDEYNEYRDTVNQIADLTPELVKGWNAQGDAILNVGTSLEELSAAYDKVMGNANQKIIADADEIFKSSIDEAKAMGTENSKLHIEYIGDTRAAARLFLNEDFGTLDSFSLPGMYAYSKDLKQITENMGLKDFRSSYFGENRESYYKYLQEYIAGLSKDERAIIEAYLNKREAEWDEIFEGRRDVFKAIVSDNLLGNYKDLSDGLKSALTAWSDTIDTDTLAGFESYQDMATYIENMFSKVSDLSPEDKNTFEMGLNLNTSFNNDEISYDEYQQKIQALLTLVDTLFDGDQDKIRQFKILFGIEEEGDEPSVFANRIGKLRFSENKKPTTALETEEAKLVDWGKEVGKDYTQFEDDIASGVLHKFGNVDMDKRAIITWSNEMKKTYQKELASWEYDPELGSIDTVWGQSTAFEWDDQEHEIAFTPIMETEDGAVFLGEKEVYDYINSVIAKAGEDGEITADEIFKIDAVETGKQYGEQFGKGLIAGVEESTGNEDINAIDAGMLMHFSGKYGAISLAKRQNVSKAGIPSDVEERMKQQGSEVADSWFHSLKNSEQEFVKNLSDEDLAEAVNFKSTEEFDKWLEELQSKAKIEVEADIKNADAVKELNDLESNWSGLDTVYQSTVKTAGTADAKDIESVNSAMGGVSKAGDEDINVLTNALEAYNTALVENNGDTKAAQDAVDKLATAYVDQSDILENLTDENKDYYIEMLKNNGVTNAEEVVMSRLGVQAQKTSAALKELSKSLVNNYNIIKQGSEADGYSDAIGDVVSKTKSLLKVTDNSGIELFSADAVDDTFVLNNLDNIRAATEGDTEALNNLRLAIARVSASDVNTDINVPTDVAEAALDNLMDMVAQADAMDIEVGASIDDSQFLQALNQMVRSGQVSADAVAAAFQSMGYDAKWVNNTTKMSFVKTGANGMPSDVAEKMVNMPSLRITRQANAGGSSRVNFGGVPAGSTSGGDRGNSGGGDNNNSEETFDWIQITIQRIEEEIARLEEQVGNTYTEWINRNKALVKEMQKTTQEIDVQKVAAKAYLDEANKVELSEDYKKKVREGALNIETIKDNEDLVNAINKYQDAYNKYVQASDAVQTLTIRQGELAKQYFDMAKEEYQEQIDLVQTYADLVDKRLNRVQEQGYFASTKYYQQLSAFEEKNIATMKEQLNAMIARRNEAIASGKIKEGSTEWHNMGNEIMQVVNAIEEATTQLVTYAKEMRQLKWDVFDYTQSYTDQLTQEADFLIDLLDNQKLYEENGQFNARGWADAALHTSKYNVEMHKALLYARERAKIEEESAKDPANKDLIERRQELLKLQQESITAAYAEKDAIKSLVEEGISLFLEQLQKVIDEYKEAQKDAKDLYEYQKNIENQTKNIASLSKQLAAYSGDDSEETMATVQKLRKQLEDAETQLKETEWDKYISETEEFLGDMYDELEEYLNKITEDTDALMHMMIDEVNGQGQSIVDTINDVAAKAGYSLTVDIATAIGDGTKIAEDFEGKFETYATSTGAAVKSIREFVASISERMAGNTTSADVYARQAKAYGTGSSGIKRDQYAWTQDGGTEFVYRTSDGALLTPLGAGDMVFTNDMSKRLYDIAKTGMIPTAGLTATSVPNYSSAVGNNIDTKIYIDKVVADNPEQFASNFSHAIKNNPRMVDQIQEVTLGRAMGNGKLNINKY